MRRNMRHHDRLSSRKCRILCRTRDVTRGLPRKRTSPGFSHRDLAATPSAGQLDGVSRPLVSRSRRFEMVQHMRSAIRGPEGEQMMLRIR